MSNSMGEPWIRGLVENILSPNAKNSINHKSRIVQVIKTNERLEYITVNDKDVFINVMFTKDCIEGLLTDYELSISDLKDSLITLSNYHISTNSQCIGSRNQDECRSSKNSMYSFSDSTIVILCEKIVSLGGHNMHTLGKPVNVNTILTVAPYLKKPNTLHDIHKRLAARQFPAYNELPNAGV